MARILIVEPVAEIRELFEHVVERLGHEPVVTDPHRTDELPNADALLVEPAGEGLDLVRAVRGRHPDVPVIFASIFPETPETKALDSVAYLLKPFRLTSLERAVEVAVAQATSPAG